jgi:drug/metabolite transporter (DMT)-like permease
MLKTHDMRLVGVAAVVIAALLWSLDGTILRPQLFALASPLVVFLEHVFGFVLLAPFLYIYRKQITHISRKQWAAIFWVALFGGALGTTFFVKALFLTGFTDISVVILLQKFQPIFAIALAAVFLKERFDKRFYLYALVALIAGYFVTFENWNTWESILSTSGAIAGFSLLAAFAWGSATVFGKYSVSNIHNGLLAALRFGLTALIMLVPAMYYVDSLASMTDVHVRLFAIIALTSGAGAIALYYWGLKRIPASVATLAELAWPVSAIFFDYMVNGSMLSVSQIIGAVILIIAVIKITHMTQK